MTSLDDLTLLQWFVSGDATLEANQSLRIQPANKARQLLGRKGALLAIAYDASTPPCIEVRRHTDYTDVLHQVLVDHHFLPIGQGLDSQVLCYAHHPIPQGYRVNYAAARQLWKQWWLHSSRRGNRPLQLDLLVLASGQWYPIRDIAINSGTLYVDTLRGENVYHGDDLVAWLEKEPCEEGDKTCFWAPPPAQAAPTPTAKPPLAVGTVPVRVPAPAPPPPPPMPVAPAPQASVDPTLAPVVYALDGKVYIQTAVGVVVVEGKELKAYKSLRQAAIAPDRPATVAIVGQRPR
ncbi:hypothetical protein [Phormidium tenue]|uniref:Uncharacterized protein n=1 Tax=Phormidium tenue NIES-30 TaxID=549789 RepID=A0A1U7J370_9CYAN|nr:hypothetical protein [Phormidium tenue]MBD2233209.1 hypothetical protein [Phormidium tenue FACHB-1052]OKH46611.1 hypothetical protein NIES30_16075 [Phormidium tenue NIES-30]